MTLTTSNNVFKIKYPSFENYIKSEENGTSETSINLNSSEIVINVNRGDVIDVKTDFKLGIAATITVSLFEGTNVIITDSTNNIQFDGNTIPILILDNYPEGDTFQIKIPKDIDNGLYKIIILFNYTEGRTYYTPNHFSKLITPVCLRL